MIKPALALSVFAMLLSSCANPGYVDNNGQGQTTPSNSLSSDVSFHVYDSYTNNSPDCVAVLPFEVKKGEQGLKITMDQAEAVRRAFYAHLAPQGKRDIELPRIDFVLSKMTLEDRKNDKNLGVKLNCSTLVRGIVTEYGSNFYGVYSKVSVGADLKLIRASDSEILWEGSHVAKSHGGSVPLSPIGLAMGIMDASNNVREEQIYRIIDDLARRLVSTIPDDRIAVLDEPLTPLKVASSKPKPESVGIFLASLDGKPLADQKISLQAALTDMRFGKGQTGLLLEKLIKVSPNEPSGYARFARYLVDTGDYAGALEQANQSLALNNQDASLHFLKGRVLIKLNNLVAADQSIVQAVAFKGNNADYLNGLGYVNSLRGNDNRALAAYQMSLHINPVNGFAYYNTGVTLQNLGDYENAADAYYGAGLAYIKSGKYGPATKALADLKELTKMGIEREKDILTLEETLKSLTKGKPNNV